MTSTSCGAWGGARQDDAVTSQPPKVAIASVGNPELPGTWSGVTAGILGGLRQIGAVPSVIDVGLPTGLEQAMLVSTAMRTLNRYDSAGASLTMRIRGAVALRHLNRTRVDGVIQIGTGFMLPSGITYVTLEDMTLRQASVNHPVFSRMSPYGTERWEKHRREIYARARMCAVASHWAGESLVNDYGIARERVGVVGFGATHLAAAADRDWSHPRFLFVGIDWERKGGPLVISAFSRVRRIRPDATLDVVGSHPPLDEPGVTGHRILSRADDHDRQIILNLFARATCFVMPSLIEPFGIAHVEAASAGVASIGSSVGGPPEVIGNEGGIVVAPGDEGGLVDAMLRLADPATARRMGVAAHERSSLYTWTKVAERLLRALGVRSPHLAEFL